MQQQFKSLCANGHQIQRLCAKQTCSVASGICSTQDCEFSTKHKKCGASVKSLGEVVGALMEHGEKRARESDDLVIGMVNKMIQNLEGFKEEYIGLKERVEYKLRGSKRRFWEMLKDGPAKKVVGEMVSDILEGNEEEEQQQRNDNNKSESLDKLKEITLRVLKSHQKGLVEIKKWIKASMRTNKNEFIFDQDLTNKSNVVVLNNDKTIRSINLDKIVFSLITPSIHELATTVSLENNPKIRAKAVKVGSISYFGLMSKTKRNFEGAHYIAQYDGVVYNSANPKENRETQQIRFRTGDIVEMEYFRKEKRLQFYNETTRDRGVLTEVQDTKQDLYFCFSTYWLNDEWEIFEEKKNENEGKK